LLLSDGKQGFDPSGGPGRRLGGERIEAVPDDRHGAVIGIADPRRFIELELARGIVPPRDPLDQPKRLAQLRDLAAGIGPGRSGGRPRLMRHGLRSYRAAAKEALTAVAHAARLGQAKAMLKALIVATSLIAAPALAQEEEPQTTAPDAFDVSGEIDLMSDYRFRGVSRSDEDPTGQAGIQVRHQSGLYAGARGTLLQGQDNFRLRDPAHIDQGEAQFDLYTGYNRDLGGGFDLDAGLMYYAFSGARGDTDYAEPYASLGFLIGPAYASLGAKYAPSQAGTGHEDMLYLFGQVDVTIPFRPWTISAQAGHQDWGRYGDYWNWSLGVRYHVRIEGLPNTEIGLSYVDTDLPSVAGQDAGVRLALELSF